MSSATARTATSFAMGDRDRPPRDLCYLKIALLGPGAAPTERCRPSQSVTSPSRRAILSRSPSSPPKWLRFFTRPNPAHPRNPKNRRIRHRAQRGWPSGSQSASALSRADQPVKNGFVLSPDPAQRIQGIRKIVASVTEPSGGGLQAPNRPRPSAGPTRPVKNGFVLSPDPAQRIQGIRKIVASVTEPSGGGLQAPNRPRRSAGPTNPSEMASFFQPQPSRKENTQKSPNPSPLPWYLSPPRA
jgi:hypothetical protein